MRACGLNMIDEKTAVRGSHPPKSELENQKIQRIEPQESNHYDAD